MKKHRTGRVSLPIAKLTATIALATTLTFTACEEKGGGGGTFTDTRDSKTYKTVKIGEQVWMAENLNYEMIEGSKCYDNDPANCKKYGRLYDWNTAIKACPSGWHLLSNEEWDKLIEVAGSEGSAYTNLKATSGWGDNNKGTDKFGFSALPGGKYGYLDPEACEDGCDPSFWDIGYGGYWWSSTGGDGGDYAQSKYMGTDLEDVDGGYFHKSRLRSVRCVKD